jgi:inward rectifier potassium channel
MTAPAARPRASRTLARDGTYNIERRGIPRRRLTYDAYHRLLVLPWRWLIAVVTAFYLTVNALFALAYLGIGNAIENARPGSFEDAFFFSVQTMATIGYGKLAPSGLGGNILVTIQSILGIAMVAVLTGLVFAKFSRPTSRVVFSRYAVVTTQNGLPTLLFRVANERDSLIVEAKIRVVVIKTERTREGATLRRFHDLKLARSETPIFPLSWTVSHVVDDESPVKGLAAPPPYDEDLEILCTLAGTEEPFAQTLHARFSYTAEEIRHAHKFVDIVSVGDDGRRIVDYTKFHEIVPE